MSESEAEIQCFRGLIESYSKEQWKNIQRSAWPWACAITRYHYVKLMSDIYGECRYGLSEEDELRAKRLVTLQNTVGGEQELDRHNIFGIALESKNNCVSPIASVGGWLITRIGSIVRYIRPTNRKEAAAIIAAYAAAEIKAQQDFGILRMFPDVDGNPLNVEWLRKHYQMSHRNGA